MADAIDRTIGVEAFDTTSGAGFQASDDSHAVEYVAGRCLGAPTVGATEWFRRLRPAATPTHCGHSTYTARGAVSRRVLVSRRTLAFRQRRERAQAEERGRAAAGPGQYSFRSRVTGGGPLPRRSHLGRGG